MLFATVVVAVVIALFAVLGIRPRGGKKVSNTQMMTAARVVLILIAVVVLYYGWPSGTP